MLVGGRGSAGLLLTSKLLQNDSLFLIFGLNTPRGAALVMGTAHTLGTHLSHLSPPFYNIDHYLLQTSKRLGRSSSYDLP